MSESIKEMLKAAKKASFEMALLTDEQKNSALAKLAQLIETEKSALKAANSKDLDENKGKISNVLYQRLELTESKISSIIQGLLDLQNLEDPTGRILEERTLTGGLQLTKKSVPIGVVGIVFESRPDVNPQVLSLILKSGNCVVLKGGSEANHSNVAFQKIVEKLNLECPFLPANWAQLITTRDDFKEMLQYHEYLDLVVPRGSNELVQTVMENTKAPVLGHADGICHIYVDESANVASSIDLIINAKSQYPSACNAVETLLVHSKVGNKFFSQFEAATSQEKILIKGCEKTRRYLKNAELATEDDWRTEYGDMVLSVKIVESTEEAISHINTFGSHHTDTILTERDKEARLFQASVDSACVFVNASTRFADGFRFGMGAEIGISTSKTHARGPVGLDGLVIYKFELQGNYNKV